MRSKPATSCESLYRKFRSFLSLPKALLNVTAFLAVVKDSLEHPQSDAECVNTEVSGKSEISEKGDASGTVRPTGLRRQTAALPSNSSESQVKL